MSKARGSSRARDHTCATAVTTLDPQPPSHEGTLIFYFFFLFRATPKAYGSSQAMAWIRTAAAGLHYSHSNVGCGIWAMSVTYTPQLTATLDPLPLSKARDRTCVLVDTSCIRYRWATRELHDILLFWSKEIPLRPWVVSNLFCRLWTFLWNPHKRIRGKRLWVCGGQGWPRALRQGWTPSVSVQFGLYQLAPAPHFIEDDTEVRQKQTSPCPPPTPTPFC